MIKDILYERTVAVCVSMDFGKGLGRSEPWSESQWSRWRKETMKTGIHIQNILKNYEKDLLYEKPEKLRFERNNIGEFHGLGYAQYEWCAFG